MPQLPALSTKLSKEALPFATTWSFEYPNTATVKFPPAGFIFQLPRRSPPLPVGEKVQSRVHWNPSADPVLDLDVDLSASPQGGLTFRSLKIGWTGNGKFIFSACGCVLNHRRNIHCLLRVRVTFPPSHKLRGVLFIRLNNLYEMHTA